MRSPVRNHSWFINYRNITDVSFMILNMKAAADTITELTNRVSFPVYQEPASQDIMGMLGGVKDDILIYDRCGLLAYHFSMPFSYLGYPFVRYVADCWYNFHRYFRN